jgi:hypothetical protein
MSFVVKKNAYKIYETRYVSFSLLIKIKEVTKGLRVRKNKKIEYFICLLWAIWCQEIEGDILYVNESKPWSSQEVSMASS